MLVECHGDDTPLTFHDTPLKASRPLIQVLVINDNSLWINDLIRDNEHRFDSRKKGIWL